MRTKLAYSVAAAALMFVGTASANENTVTQTGSGNSATVDQTIDESLASGLGVGKESRSLIDQLGDNNTATVAQGGETGASKFSIPANESDIDQENTGTAGSTGNVASVTQYSTDPSSAVPNTADVNQTTDGALANTATVSQTSAGTAGVSLQNNAVVNQGQTSGTGGETAMVSQSGDSNNVLVNQDGVNNVADTAQDGFLNVATVSQIGDGDDALITQTGEENDSTITQDGVEAYADNIQTGDRNTSTIAQNDGSSGGSIEARFLATRKRLLFKLATTISPM